jgi:hypothetical protein
MVPGRRIVGFRVLEQGPGLEPVRAGRPASVEVTVEAVGALGKGVLRLFWPGENRREPTTLLTVPLPLPAPGRVWDPRVRYGDDWECKFEAWKDQPILEADLPEETLARPTDDLALVRHRLRLLLPDFMELRTLEGTVTWGPTAPDVEGQSGLTRTLPATRVGSGLVVFPHWALPGDEIIVLGMVRSEQGAGSTETFGFDYTVPGQAPGHGMFTERDEESGIVYLKGSFQTDQPGEYRVSLASNAPPWARAALPGHSVVRVPFRMSSDLPADRPLVLFTGKMPIFWLEMLGYKKKDGGSYKVQRPDVLSLYPGGTPVDLGDAKFGFLGAYLRADDYRPSRPMDPALEPRVTVINPGDVQTDAKAPREWPVNERGQQLALIADITDPPAGQSEHSPGVVPCLTRWLISGRDAEGLPIAFVYQQPFDLWVTSNVSYTLVSRDGQLLIATGVLLVALLLAGLFFLGARRTRVRAAPARPQKSTVPVPTTAADSPHPGTNNDLDGAVPSTQPRREAPSKPRESRSLPKTSQEPKPPRETRPPRKDHSVD